MKKLVCFMLLNFLIFWRIEESFAFSYSEALSGDLYYQNIGNLDLGLNTISGTAFSDTEGDVGEFDQDFFAFNIPEGMQLTGINFEWETIYTDNIGSPSARWVYGIYDYNFNYNYYQLIVPSILGIGSTGDISISPAVGEGEYFMGQGGSITTGDKFTTSYILSLTTTPVPIPSAIWLLSSGLIGFVRFSSRR